MIVTFLKLVYLVKSAKIIDAPAEKEPTKYINIEGMICLNAKNVNMAIMQLSIATMIQRLRFLIRTELGNGLLVASTGAKINATIKTVTDRIIAI